MVCESGALNVEDVPALNCLLPSHEIVPVINPPQAMILGIGAASEQPWKVDGAIGLARLARDTGVPPIRLTHAFGDLGERLGLDWAQQKAAVMVPSDPWERLLVAGVARDFQQMRFEFLRGLAKSKRGKENPLARIEEWATRHAIEIDQFRTMIGRAQGAAPLSPAMLAQIASQARNLLQR